MNGQNQGKETGETEVTVFRQEGATFQSMETAELRRLKEQTMMGYLAINLVEPPEGAVWGVFNDRELDTPWVKKLANDYQVKGLENCLPDSAIDVVVKADWLAPGVTPLPTIGAKTIRMVPAMKFSEAGLEAIRDNNLWVLSGNHRRAALLKHMEMLKVKLEKTTKAKEQVEDELKEEPSVTSQRALDLKRLEHSAMQLEALIESSQMWVVRLYNRGELHQKSKVDEKTEIRGEQI